jgi:thiosulfate/3-mercaptopyruvate sulfurtransferase
MAGHESERFPRRRIVLAGMAAGAALALARHGGARGQATPQPALTTQPGHLIDAAAVAPLLGASAFRPVALAGDAPQAQAFIPGSELVDWHEMELMDTVNEAAVTGWADNMSALFARVGLNRDDEIVNYDDGSLFAPRPWWVMRLLGYANVQVLNGGFPAWQQVQGAEAPAPASPSVASSPPVATDRRWEMLARLPEIVEHLEDPDWILVDARTPEEYERGHIPGAVNINFLRNVREDGPPFWRSPADLHAMYEAAGVTPDKHVVPYCATGARSAVTDFTLRWLGYPSVALYSASWQEWDAEPDTPKTKGDKP